MLTSSARSAGLIVTPLYYAVSAVMVAWHWLFTELGLDPDAGWRGRCRSWA